MSGLWYVLFFWTGIPAIVGLVEGILLLLEEESKFNQKYNHGYVPPKPVNQAENQVDQLERLANLKEQDLISEEEFEKAKMKILDS